MRENVFQLFSEFARVRPVRWIAVILFTILFLVLLVRLKPGTVDIPDTVLVVFQVSGTIVALVLPAAQFANGIVTNLIDNALDRVLQAQREGSLEEVKQREEAASEIIADAEGWLLFAWWGSVYSLCAFFLSAITQFLPADYHYLSLSFAFGFLIVGVGLLFLTAWWAYQLQALRGVVRMFSSASVSTETRSESSGVRSSGAGWGQRAAWIFLVVIMILLIFFTVAVLGRGQYELPAEVGEIVAGSAMLA